MSATRERATQALLILVLLALLTLIAMVATRAQGGPLDPPAPPGSTSSVRLPGTLIGPPVSPATYPIVISTPGHFYLTANLAVPPDMTGIRISASDVTLDLGGFTISGSGTGAASGVTTFGSTSRVTITNGVVRGFPGTGISTLSSTHAVIEDVTTTANNFGIRAGSDTIIRDCITSLNTDGGILVSGSNTRIENCVVTANAFIGLSLQNGGALVVQDSTIAGNNTVLNATGGMLLNQMDGSTIRNNDFYGNNGTDVFLTSGSDFNIFVGNTFECPVVTNSGAENFVPINSATDDGTNRSHRVSCEGQ